MSDGKNLAQAFNTAANGLTAEQSAMNTQISDTVGQINSLTSRSRSLMGKFLS